MLTQPVDAAAKSARLADDDRHDSKLSDQPAAIPARRERRYHDGVLITALPAGFAKRIGLAVDGRVALLNTPVASLPQQSSVPVEQRSANRDTALRESESRFLNRDVQHCLVFVERHVANSGRGMWNAVFPMTIQARNQSPGRRPALIEQGLWSCDIRAAPDSPSAKQAMLSRQTIEGGFLCSYNSYMEKASVSKLKNNLSAYLRKVRAGHAVVIYDREVPIARLERIESAGLGSDRLLSLHAKGVTRLPLRRASALAAVAGVGTPLPAITRLLEAVQHDRSDDR